MVAHGEGPTTSALLGACNRRGVEARLLTPGQALGELRPGDTALARLDVRFSLDGVESGLWELRVLEREGVRVLNRAGALVAAHDKLAAAARLHEAGVPHPHTVLVGPEGDLPQLAPPLVLKPRFGSWGRDVFLCEDEAAVDSVLALFGRRPWFRATGAIAQELVPPAGWDLRVVVAGGNVVGAVQRISADGEWRTNVALGGARRPVEPPEDACALARAAAAAIGADLAGVDLLPRPDGGFVAVEVNGAVDFTRQYRRDGDVFEAAVDALLAAAYTSSSAAASRLTRPAPNVAT